MNRCSIIHKSLYLALFAGWSLNAVALPLPDDSTVNSATPALQITNTGSGRAGSFLINNGSNANYALYSQSNGKGISLYGNMVGSGRAGVFQINNLLNLNPALTGYTSGLGQAGLFQINNANNNAPALSAMTNGSGSAIKGVAGTGLAGEFTGNVSATGWIQSGGTFGSSTDALELYANGLRLYRMEKSPGYTSFGSIPNLIGGYSGNIVASGIVGATIGGGGWTGENINVVTGHFGTVSGGYHNLGGYYAVVSGGYNNRADSSSSTVGGGHHNLATQENSTVGGGANNQANSIGSTVSGGVNNNAGGPLSNRPEHYSTVGGGQNNVANGLYATVIGGGTIMLILLPQ